MNDVKSVLDANEKLAENIVPKLDVTLFNRQTNQKTTFNSGLLIPIYYDEILPGDSIDLNIAAILRSISPIASPIDVAKLSIHAFYVPNRLIVDDFYKFMSGESSSKWLDAEEVASLPLLKSTSTFTGYTEDDLAGYLNLPLYKDIFSNGKNTYNRLLINAYIKIWNDWYRDVNLQDEIVLNLKDDLDVKNIKTINEDSFYTNIQYGKELAPVSRYVDYFSACLPSPQRGDAVILSDLTKLDVVYNDIDPSRSDLITTASTDNFFNINDLRFAIAMQQYKELSARGGNRYIDFVYNNFGVESKDARAQRAQYLGGYSHLIQTTTITSTSATPTQNSSNSGLGAFGAQTNSVFQTEENVVGSFTEHGVLMITACVRPESTYSQGIEKFWNKKTNFDFYVPSFDNIGEQPIYQSEIYLEDDFVAESKIFGYNEAWADYRYKLSKSNGYFSANSKYLNTYRPYSYQVIFDKSPKLNDSFIRAGQDQIGQTLVVTDSKISHQYYATFYFDNKHSRVMKLHSVPGLRRI